MADLHQSNHCSDLFETPNDNWTESFDFTYSSNCNYSPVDGDFLGNDLHVDSSSLSSFFAITNTKDIATPPHCETMSIPQETATNVSSSQSTVSTPYSPPQSTPQRREKRKRATTKDSKSRSTKKRKCDEATDREMLAKYDAMENLTEDQKRDRKKIYNRITARQSRERSKKKEHELEQKIAQLEKENRMWKEKYFHVVSLLSKYETVVTSQPCSPLHSESSDGDSESNGRHVAFGSLVLLFICILWLVAMSSSSTIPHAGYDKSINAATPQDDLSLVVHNTGGSSYHGGSYSLGENSIIPAHIPHRGPANKRLLLAGTDSQTARALIPTITTEEDSSSKPTIIEEVSFYTHHDEKTGQKTTYFYCPSLFPLLTSDTDSRLHDSRATSYPGNHPTTNRLVLLHPTEQFDNQNVMDEKIVKLSQIELDRFKKLEHDAFLVLGGGHGPQSSRIIL